MIRPRAMPRRILKPRLFSSSPPRTLSVRRNVPTMARFPPTQQNRPVHATSHVSHPVTVYVLFFFSSFEKMSVC